MLIHYWYFSHKFFVLYQVDLFDRKGNLISTFIGKQDEKTIRESIDNLKKERKSHQEIFNAEFSTIQENKKNEVSPRSHG